MPVDDENTLSVTWAFNRVPKEYEPYEQERIPSWHGPTHHADGSWITSHVMNQDFASWAGQGRIADRTRERLRGERPGRDHAAAALLADSRRSPEARSRRG